MSKNTVVGFLIFTFAFAIGLNEVIQSSPSSKGQASNDVRKVANIDDVNFNDQKQIDWEQELAKTLSQSQKPNTKLAEKPTSMDQFYYGTLQGKYSLVFSDRKISKIQLNSQSEEGLNLTFEKVLTEHKDLFDYASQFKSLSSRDSKQIYQWTGKSGSKYTAQIEKNTQNQIVKVEIQNQ